MTRMWMVLGSALALMTALACDRQDDRRIGRTTPGDDRLTQDRDLRPTDSERQGSENPDPSWMTKAAEANLAEVAAGRLAAEKGSSADVKQFGEHMVEDHGKANAELMELARAKGITLPEKPGSEAQKDLDKLSGLSGAEFDKRFAGMMVTDHVKAVSHFEKGTKEAKDSDVKSFAEKTLPTLQEHLKMARELNTKVGGQPTAD